MKVLLLNPQSDTQKATPFPLGLMYLASYLEKFNHEVKIIDLKSQKLTKQKLKEETLEFAPNFIGIRCLTFESASAYSLARFMKSLLPKTAVILGGPHASAKPLEILQQKPVDYVVIGEGEITLKEIVSKKRPSTIKGIGYKEKGKIKFTQPRDYIKNLDEIPFPAYSKIDMQEYFNNPYTHAFFKAEKKIGQIFTSRGCPFHCIYCHKLFGKTIRFRSAENVLKEIELLYHQYGIREFQIEDDSFNVNMNRAKSIMNLIIKSNMKIKISFPNGIRADFVDEELAQNMKKAGVYSVCFGIESGDLEIQKFIEKNLDLSRVKKAIELTTKNGIMTTGYFMIGFLGETREQVIRTIQFAKNSKLHMATFFKVIPYPNTKLYDLAKEQGFNMSNRPEDYTYTFSTMSNLNLSKVNSQELENLIKRAYREFFSPLRIMRLGLKAPNKHMLFVNFFRLLLWKN